MTKSSLLVVAIAVFLTACTSTRNVETFDASQAASAVDAKVQQSSVVAGSDYLLARNSFVDDAMQFLESQKRKAQSPARKVKSIIGGVGAIVGIGGLASTFLIDNEDTRTTVAQVSGSVASLSGIIALIPAASMAVRCWRTPQAGSSR